MDITLEQFQKVLPKQTKGLLTSDMVDNLNVLMTDKEREELLAIRKTEAYKRGRYNAEMKKYNSKSRLYKDPVEERLVKVRNELRRKERQLLKKEVRQAESKLKEVESKLKD